MHLVSVVRECHEAYQDPVALSGLAVLIGVQEKVVSSYKNLVLSVADAWFLRREHGKNAMLKCAPGSLETSRAQFRASMPDNTISSASFIPKQMYAHTREHQRTRFPSYFPQDPEPCPSRHGRSGAWSFPCDALF